MTPEPSPWWNVFTFARDGITGSELLGIVLVAGMIVILFVVQYGEKNAAKKVDFAWLFMDQATHKVSRSGVMAFGGFLLGCWVVVDAEGNGKLDWSFLGIFLSYCAGVRALEIWKPKDEAVVGKRETTTLETKTELLPPAEPDPPPPPPKATKTAASPLSRRR